MVFLQGPPSRPQQKIRHLHRHFISGTTVFFRNIVTLYIGIPYIVIRWSIDVNSM